MIIFTLRRILLLIVTLFLLTSSLASALSLFHPITRRYKASLWNALFWV